MRSFFKNSTFQLIFALVAGAVFGGIMKLLPPWIYLDDIVVNGIFKLLGNGFIELIKMTVMPLVFVSIVCGVSSFGDTKRLGSIGGKTLFVFFITTLISIVIAISLSLLIKPGEGLNMGNVGGELNYVPQQTKNAIDIILEIIPSNPVQAMSKGNLLQVLVFALFFGIALGKMGEKSSSLIKTFNVINDCIMQIVSIIMKIAPFGVFALISNTVYSIGIESLIGILKMSLVVILGLALQMFVVYGLIYRLTTGLSFFDFLKRYSKTAGIAFSTSSSNATLPFSMEMMDGIGVSKSIYQFVLPIGATVNMAGTAIMQGVSAVFIAQAYGLDLPINSLFTITITAIFASVGAAGVPGVGMIMMTMILESAGLPVEGLALIIGIDRLLDMVRTVVNVMGDCVCSVVVAKSEGEISSVCSK